MTFITTKNLTQLIYRCTSFTHPFGRIDVINLGFTAKQLSLLNSLPDEWIFKIRLLISFNVISNKK